MMDTCEMEVPGPDPAMLMLPSTQLSKLPQVLDIDRNVHVAKSVTSQLLTCTAVIYKEQTKSNM